MQFAYARIRMSLRFITTFRAGSDELRGVSSEQRQLLGSYPLS